MFGEPQKVRPFPVNCRRDTVWCWKSGTKNANWLHNPRKERTDVWSVGTGKLDNADILAGLGFTPEGETTHPAKLRHVSTWNFNFDSVTCKSSQRCTTCEMRFSNSEGEDAHINLSSIFRHQGKPSTTRSECRQFSSVQFSKWFIPAIYVHDIQGEPEGLEYMNHIRKRQISVNRKND